MSLPFLQPPPSVWRDCHCIALHGETHEFHVQRCPVRVARRKLWWRAAKVVGLGFVGGWLAAWLFACSFGEVSKNGDLHGFACLSGRIERCYHLPTPTPGPPIPTPTPGSLLSGLVPETPALMEVCDRIVGGDMPATGWGMIVSVIASITALLTAHPFW